MINAAVRCLVGPRRTPALRRAVRRRDREYHERPVPIGITGWGSRSTGFWGDTSIETRVRSNQPPIENWSLWRDLVITCGRSRPCSASVGDIRARADHPEVAILASGDGARSGHRRHPRPQRVRLHPACSTPCGPQTYPDLQIVVVDGSSRRHRRSSPTWPARSPRAGGHNPDQADPGPNLALAHARGEWFVRADAHCRIDDDATRAGRRTSPTGRWAGVGRPGTVGSNLPGPGHRRGHGLAVRSGQTTTTEPRPDRRPHPFRGPPDRFVRDLGAGNENQLVNEDFEFDYRVRRSGGEPLFDPAIRIDWDWTAARASRRCSASTVATGREGPDPGPSPRVGGVAPPRRPGGGRRPGRIAPAARRSAGPDPLGAAAAGRLRALVAVASMRTGTDLAPRDRQWVPAAFVALHLGWGLGFWRDRSSDRRAGRGSAALPGGVLRTPSPRGGGPGPPRRTTLIPEPVAGSSTAERLPRLWIIREDAGSESCPASHPHRAVRLPRTHERDPIGRRRTAPPLAAVVLSARGPPDRRRPAAANCLCGMPDAHVLRSTRSPAPTPSRVAIVVNPQGRPGWPRPCSSTWVTSRWTSVEQRVRRGPAMRRWSDWSGCPTTMTNGDVLVPAWRPLPRPRPRVVGRPPSPQWVLPQPAPAVMDDPTGYGRVIPLGDGKVAERGSEHNDADAEERAVDDQHVGSTASSQPARPRAAAGAARQRPGEYYLTDVVSVLSGTGHRVGRRGP